MILFIFLFLIGKCVRYHSKICHTTVDKENKWAHKIICGNGISTMNMRNIHSQYVCIQHKKQKTREKTISNNWMVCKMYISHRGSNIALSTMTRKKCSPHASAFTSTSLPIHKFQIVILIINNGEYFYCSYRLCIYCKSLSLIITRMIAEMRILSILALL